MLDQAQVKAAAIVQQQKEEKQKKDHEDEETKRAAAAEPESNSLSTLSGDSSYAKALVLSPEKEKPTSKDASSPTAGNPSKPSTTSLPESLDANLSAVSDSMSPLSQEAVARGIKLAQEVSSSVRVSGSEIVAVSPDGSSSLVNSESVAQAVKLAELSQARKSPEGVHPSDIKGEKV